MRQFMITTFLLLAGAAGSAQAQGFIENKDYYPVVPAQHTNVDPGKIEVLEVFSYGCPFCSQLNPFMREYRRTLPPNVQLLYLPASFNPAEDWPMFQRAAITAQVLGIFDKTHDAVFDSVWNGGELAILDPATKGIRSRLPTIEDAARFYARVGGVPAAEFLEVAHGFAVDTRIRAAENLILAYHVDSTPTIIVNGKYRITGVSAGNLERMIAVTRWLVAQETAAAAKAATPAKTAAPAKASPAAATPAAKGTPAAPKH